MTDTIQIFVNDRRAVVPTGASVLDAVASVDGDAGRALRAGRAYVADGVGRTLELDRRVEPGTILRVVRSARRSQPSDARS